MEELSSSSDGLVNDYSDQAVEMDWNMGRAIATQDHSWSLDLDWAFSNELLSSSLLHDSLKSPRKSVDIDYYTDSRICSDHTAGRHVNLSSAAKQTGDIGLPQQRMANTTASQADGRHHVSSSPNVQLRSIPSVSDTCSSSAAKIEQPQIISSQPSEPIVHSEEDMLLMYYLDKVFHMQYPFYGAKGLQSRGWLYSVIRRFQSVRNGTLALSNYAIRFDGERSVTSISGDPTNNYYSLALGAIQVVGSDASRSESASEAEDLSLELGKITCILQALFYQVIQ